jgi:hypothetical protein
VALAVEPALQGFLVLGMACMSHSEDKTGVCRGCGNRIVIRGGCRPRVWCSERCRKNQYRVPCEKCGAACGGTANARVRYCGECTREIVAGYSRAYGNAVRAEVSALWLEGRSLREIGEVMEWTTGSVGAYIGRLRAKGYKHEFPPRNNVSVAGHRKISAVARATRRREWANVG